MNNLKKQWLGNIKNDLLSGTVVALALIPEAIAFSVMAGVDPKVGLYASFCIAVVIAIIGGRAGMISAATGAMAIVMVTLVKNHGIEYLFAATILTGIIQVIAGFFRFHLLLKFVSRSVITGFVNALAILIFMAQLPEFNNANISLYAMVALGLAIIYLFPYITNKIPSPLIAIIALTILQYYFNFDIRTVSEIGELPTVLPDFLIPNIPYNFDSFKIILPYAITLAMVGLLESLMTAVIVDNFTDTKSNKATECKGQGIANIISGFFGGMAGCAMIGQSVINVKSGGRGRLSTLWAGIFLLILILLLADILKIIPMAALVAIMIMVSIGTFNWQSIINIKKIPKTSSFVMLVTVIVVLLTHDLAQGVLAGVLMSAVFFAYKVSDLVDVEKIEISDDKHLYNVYGQIFFVSSDKFLNSFEFNNVIKEVEINLHKSHLWDYTAIETVEKVIMKFKREAVKVTVTGLNESSRTLYKRLSEIEDISKDKTKLEFNND